MSKLQQLIKQASQQYYSEGTSPISDEKFDSLLEELKKEDPSNALLTDTGHGYEPDKVEWGKKENHLYGEVKGLDKCHSFEEAQKLKFDLNSDSIASLKLDGMSVVLYYESGQLITAVTRGNGTTGINVTDRILQIDPDLGQVDSRFTGATRGEILMCYPSFEAYVKSHPDTAAANPRNTTAGLIKSGKDLNFLSVVMYSVIGLGKDTNYEMSEQFSSYVSTIYWLTSNFKEVVQHTELTSDQLSSSNFFSTMEELNTKWYGHYPADGIVLANMNNSITSSGTDYAVTNESIAFKYPSECQTTVVTQVEWNLGKTKILVPKIGFEPLELAGTTVKWAHGDNAKNIKDNGIAVGAVVEVSKRGEIIPHIEDVIEPKEAELPTHCPACGEKLIWQGVHLMCPNTQCGDANVQDILIWCKNIAPYFGIGDNLTVSYLEKFLPTKDMRIESIYEYKEWFPDSSPLINEQKFLDMIHMLFTEKVSLETAILALNIPRISTATAPIVAKYPEFVKELMEYGTGNTTAEMIKDIGQANMLSIRDNAWKFRRLSLIESNIDFTPNKQSASSKGKVAITGTLSMKRSQFEDILKANGWDIASSVSKTTKFLITDDPNSNSGKNAKAASLGIPKITEKEFVEKYLK